MKKTMLIPLKRKRKEALRRSTSLRVFMLKTKFLLTRYQQFSYGDLSRIVKVALHYYSFLTPNNEKEVAIGQLAWMLFTSLRELNGTSNSSERDRNEAMEIVGIILLYTKVLEDKYSLIARIDLFLFKNEKTNEVSRDLRDLVSSYLRRVAKHIYVDPYLVDQLISEVRNNNNCN